tara:strand:+ start:1421 stop:2428 length:1008 start_codon:yes stop_codon:yes gene_type:complete
MNNIAIIGSSPVSLIYAILLSKLKINSTIFCGNNFGGAWKNHKLLNYDIPISTHIFMYSNGLKKTFDQIGYHPKLWEIKPFLIDDKYNFISYFGNSDYMQMGAPILNDCLIKFLSDKIENDKNICLKKNKTIDKLFFKNSKNDPHNQYIFDGAIMTSGNKLNLFVNEKKTEFKSKRFIVHSLSIIAYSINKIKSCFIHIEGEKALIRELQSIPLSEGYLIINCKISLFGNKNSIDKIIKEVKSLFKKLLKVELDINKYQPNIYYNWRYCYSIDSKSLDNIPLLIPGITNIKNNNMQYIIKNSQDLSKIFSDYDKIIKDIFNKLNNKKYDCLIKIK